MKIFISGHYSILRKKNCIFLLDYLTCHKRKILFVIAKDDFIRFIVTSKLISIWYQEVSLIDRIETRRALSIIAPVTILSHANLIVNHPHIALFKYSGIYTTSCCQLFPSYILHIVYPGITMLHTFSFRSIDNIYKECRGCLLWRYKLCSYLSCIWKSLNVCKVVCRHCRKNRLFFYKTIIEECTMYNTTV